MNEENKENKEIIPATEKTGVPEDHKEISFEIIPDKTFPEFQNVPELKKEIIEKMEKKQLETELKEAAGEPKPAPTGAEAVPKEFPKLMFRIAGKAIKCDKMQLDNEDAAVFAKHLSNLIGAQNSKVFSLIILISIILSKIYDCWDTLGGLIQRGKKALPGYNEKTESNKTEGVNT